MIKLSSKWLNNVWMGKSALIGCNAMLIPFALPLVAWLVICQCYSALLSAASGAVGGATVLTLIGLLPCALIYAVGLAGAIYCYRNALVDGNMDIRKRFARGIRKNAPEYILFVFIMWLSTGLLAVTPALYLQMGIGLLYGVGLIVSVFQFAVIMPVMCLAIMQCAYYGDRLGSVFYNAFKLYFMRPLRTIGTTALCALPFCVCVILPFVWQLVFWVLYAVVGVSVGIVFYLWYAKTFFDGVIGHAARNADMVVLGADDAPPLQQPVPQTADGTRE